jgi:hypothetical protein
VRTRGSFEWSAAWSAWSAAALVSASCSGGSTSPSGLDAGDAGPSHHVDARATDATHHDAHVVDAQKTHPKDSGHPHDSAKEATGPVLAPGEYCVGGPPTIRFDPPEVVVAAGKSRPVKAIVEPDLCTPSTLSFSSSDTAVAAAPATGNLDIRHPTYSFVVQAGALSGGSTSATATLTASMPGVDGGAGGTATLPIIVNDGSLPTCAPSDVASGKPSGPIPGPGAGSSCAALSQCCATLSPEVASAAGCASTVAAGEADGGTADGGAAGNCGNLLAVLQDDGVCGATVQGTGGLATAQLSVPPFALTRTDEWQLPAFTATIACANDDLTRAKAASGAVKGHAAAPGNLVPIGPAVTFTASAPIDMTHSLRHEIDFQIPVNPAAIPTDGRMRHLSLLFMSPASSGVVTNPQVISIANPQITQTASGSFVLQFTSPWFGTYQAAFAPDAGTVTRTRHLTHRAVIGFSMGASGAGSFGFRHHDQFDMVGPLGGPSDWSWLFWYIETYFLGGFCPVTLADGSKNPAYPNCPPNPAPNLYTLHETYAHTCDYDHWFFQEGAGTGGHFSRSTYAELFDDLSLMHGNANGQNYDPNAPDASTALSFFPAGIKATDPWVVGDAGGLPGSCAVATSPLSPDPNPADPPLAVQNQWQSQCTDSRCDPANTWKAKTGYYDARYNPTGSLQVVSYCESGTQTPANDPYEDLWVPPQPGNDLMMDGALAVDVNGNGMRDYGEPVIHQGHEPWSDVGVDGLADVDEPGYDPVTNPDPNQDDYDYQLNPGGTEGDHRYEMGEPFLDYGLDGVLGTPQLSQGGYDYGEGDGLFTLTTGAQSYYDADPHSILRQWSVDIPGGALTDTALLRLNIWADGGARDMANFGAVSNHLVGSIATRKVAAGSADSGTQLRTTAFYNGFDRLPGQTIGEANFDINAMRWADIVDGVDVRYGSVDATPLMIANGDGQHVGTGQQLLDRLQSAIYYAEQQWPDADRTLTDTLEEQVTGDAGLPPGGAMDAGSLLYSCSGMLCNFPFAADNRVGPVYVTLPPGYTLPANIVRNVRYPVIYLLHGYGQTPDGLAASALVSTNYMNDAARSEATRLGKAILVYVDGRCRFSSDDPPQPECIQGSFYLDSDRPDNAHPGTKVAQFDAWFDDLITYIDQNFRTMGPTDVEVTE